MADCARCPLSCGRHTLVFGVGDPHAELMFVGEAPGRNEDLKGEPFVGAAGHLLDELLASIGLVRGQVYIANVLKCRPPDNRDPQPAEIAECAPFLAEQIRLIDPKVIATLGNFATKFVLKTETGITRLHGSVQLAGRFKVLPIFHPAAAIYDRTKRDALFADFELLRSLLAEQRAEQPAPSPRAPVAAETPSEPDASPAGPAGEAPTPEQTSLF